MAAAMAHPLGSHELIGLAVQHQGGDMQTGEGGAPIPAGQDRSPCPCVCAGIESAPGMHEFADLA